MFNIGGIHMAKSNMTKCAVVCRMQWTPNSLVKNAVAQGVSESFAKETRNEFCTASGLECRRNPDNGHLYFGTTEEILAAWDPGPGKLERLVGDILATPGLLAAGPRTWAEITLFQFTGGSAAFPGGGDTGDWVGCTLHQLATQCVIAELTRDINWRPGATAPPAAVDGPWERVFEHVRANPTITLEELRSAATGFGLTRTIAAFSQRLKEAGFIKRDGKWQEATIPPSNGLEDEPTTAVDPEESEAGNRGYVMVPTGDGIELRGDCTAADLKRVQKKCRDIKKKVESR